MIWREVENKNSAETLDEKNNYHAFLLAIVNFSSSPLKRYGLINIKKTFLSNCKFDTFNVLATFYLVALPPTDW